MEQHPDESPRSEEGSRTATELAPGNVPARIGHLPDTVDPLEPRDPDTAFEATRRLRHDGWTPQRMRLFHERFAECGVVREACEASGMSARSAYNLRDRDPLFAAGWAAATLKARTRLADEAFSRSMNGVVERIYKDGAIVAERHRYDNRLTMAVLARLDARIDRAEATGDPRLLLAARWDEYLQALGDDRREDGLALLDPPPPAAPVETAEDRELRELHEEESRMMADDRHRVWEDEDGAGWLTNYPPPPGFKGRESGVYGKYNYQRTLSPFEQAVIANDEVEEAADALARGHFQRDRYFSLGASD